MKRMQLTSALAGVVVGVVLTIAAVAWAQPKPADPPAAGGAPAVIQGLSADTFVSVKDHGTAQTVIVYKVDDKGMARLSHKAKFFY